MGRFTSVAMIFCAIGVGLSAPSAQLPLRQQEVRDAVSELRRSVNDVATLLARIRPDEINDEAIFFEGQTRRLYGIIAVARCVEAVNDTLPATQEKTRTAASLRLLITELSEAAHGLKSIEQARQRGSSLLASKSFESFDKAQARPAVSVSEAITP